MFNHYNDVKLLCWCLFADKAKQKKKDSVNIRFTFNNDAADGNVEALSETKKMFTQGKCTVDVIVIY